MMYLARQEPERPTILVSKDSNLRINAKALGIAVQDYNIDKAESFDKLYTGKQTDDLCNGFSSL